MRKALLILRHVAIWLVLGSGFGFAAGIAVTTVYIVATGVEKHDHSFGLLVVPVTGFLLGALIGAVYGGERGMRLAKRRAADESSPTIAD